jgi:hypothetical protein
VPPARDANACLARSVARSGGNKTNRGQDGRVVLPGHNTTISPTNRPPPRAPPGLCQAMIIPQAACFGARLPQSGVVLIYNTLVT